MFKIQNSSNPIKILILVVLMVIMGVGRERLVNRWKLADVNGRLAIDIELKNFILILNTNLGLTLDLILDNVQSLALSLAVSLFTLKSQIIISRNV